MNIRRSTQILPIFILTTTMMVYRYFVTLFILLTVCQTACHGQITNLLIFDKNSNKTTFHGGATAGLNFLQVDGDGYRGYNKTGPVAGILVYAPLSGYVGISIELSYNTKGAKNTTSSASGIAKYNLTINYVEIPIMFYLLPHCLGNRFHIKSGVSYSRLISFKETIISNNALSYDIGKHGIDGIGAIVYQLSEKLYVDMRYSYSMFSIRESTVEGRYIGLGKQKQYHNNFSLRLLYMVN